MSIDGAAEIPWGARMTLDEWGDLPEDVEGEVVDGVLVEEEMTNCIHEAVVSFLNAVLRGWVRPLGGLVGGSEAKFAVTDRRGRKPDLSVYLPGRPRPPGHDVPGCPGLSLDLDALWAEVEELEGTGEDGEPG
jgi:Uma2 family endonuclease